MAQVEIEDVALEEVRVLPQISLDTVIKDNYDASFMFYTCLTDLDINIALIGQNETDENGVDIFEVIAPTEVEAEEVRTLRILYDQSPAGRLVKDVSDGNYKAFMPEDRYLGGDRNLTSRHVHLKPKILARAFLTAFGRHLYLRNLDAINTESIELLRNMSFYDFDQGAVVYRDQLSIWGIPPLSAGELRFLSMEQLTKSARSLGIEVPDLFSED